ncbi:MAG: alpha/beta hydrolase [Bacteroidota bacterium]
MKKSIIKLLKVLASIIATLFLAIVVFIFFTGPQLPENTDQLIENVVQSEPPEFVKGTADYVISDSLKIWYECISPEDSIKGNVLLFMGISNDAMGWPPEFLKLLVDSGYRVIRYDYRSTGMSDWIEDYQKSPFSLRDLGKDAVTILDTLKIQKAHLVGVSLGGMVAQDFAIFYPERTSSLSSIMSSGNIIDPELPGISKTTILKLIKIGIRYNIIKNEKNTIKLNLTARTILRGSSLNEKDIKEISEQVLYNMRKRNGYNIKSSEQHQAATLQSGSRYDKLKNINIPILLIHGEKDPLIPIEHSKKLASIIPHAKTRWFQGLGHDIPHEYTDSVSNELIAHFGRIRNKVTSKNPNFFVTQIFQNTHLQ